MIYQDYILGDIRLRYLRDEETGHIAMILLPAETDDRLTERKDTLHETWDVGNLCYLSLQHHSQGRAAGSSLKYGESSQKLKYMKQEKTEDDSRIIITTTLEADEGYQVLHTVEYTKGECGIEVETTFVNRTGRMVTIDMISSFALDNLSPLQTYDASDRLKLHRFRGGWSIEGKHCENTVEDLNLEPSWARAFPESERYGVLGSFPVKRWFPFGCVEDMERHVYWAVQLGCNSSWQMELSRDGDCYSLSGGLADREFGGWWKDIQNGELFTAPKAYISVSDVSFWDVCQNITDMFHKYADRQPECEQDLPIIFNEWCTTWGKPTHDNMLKTADRLQGIPVEYMVIDAGWSKKEVEDNDPQGSNGDWERDEEKFPKGFLALSREMKEKGYRLGIWMEFEVTTLGAKVHSGIYDSMHLYRNGEIIQTGATRRFWDFRKPEVKEYLKEKVIRFLKENEFGYLKVDYNDSMGSGCDGAESPGEGLRAQMEAVHRFFELIRAELPDLVIENCSSGGHRLEPSMTTVTSMSSFSDAHECKEIPYIAADLHQLILPRQSQIWSVISPDLPMQVIRCRLVSGMLGRFCLSGRIGELDDAQVAEVRKAALFYREVKDIIKDGRSVLYRDSSRNHHHLKGAQVLVRESGDRYVQQGRELLLVYHSFEDPAESISGELPDGDWEITGHIGEDCHMEITGNRFAIRPQNSWEAFAVHLTDRRSMVTDSE